MLPLSAIQNKYSLLTIVSCFLRHSLNSMMTKLSQCMTAACPADIILVSLCFLLTWVDYCGNRKATIITKRQAFYYQKGSCTTYNLRLIILTSSHQVWQFVWHGFAKTEKIGWKGTPKWLQSKSFCDKMKHWSRLNNVKCVTSVIILVVACIQLLMRLIGSATWPDLGGREAVSYKQDPSDCTSERNAKQYW